MTSANPLTPAIAVVIPCFRVTATILDVLAGVGPECQVIYVVDDACPDRTADLVETEALDPRGELYTDANVGERVAVRNLLDELRGGGLITGGPANFSAKDRQTFASELDRWLTAATR